MSSNLPSLSLAAPMLKWPGFEVPLPVVSKLTVSGGLSPGCAGAGQRVMAAGLRGDDATAVLPTPAPSRACPLPPSLLIPISVVGAPGLNHAASARLLAPHRAARWGCASPGMLSCCSCRFPCSP